MTRQWLRECRLTLGGEQIDVSGMRIQFEVRYATVQHPTFADITIENLSDATIKKVSKEGDPVTLEAGYQEGYGLIFKGTVAFKRTGRSSPTETYLNLQCKSGDKAYRNAVVSKTLAAGHTFNDQLKVAIDAMKQQGIEVGHIATLDNRKFPRAITLYGMAREVLRRVCQANDCSWTIHNGKLQVTKNREGLPGGAIVLNSRTGMIGRPVETFDGIEARCLLNPRINPGSKIQIDEKSIERARLPIEYGNQTPDVYVPGLSADGVYQALAVRHIGDTRANGPWFTEMVCIRGDGVRYSEPSGTNIAAYSDLPVAAGNPPQGSFPTGGQ